MWRVRGHPDYFWAEYDALPENDPRRSEIEEIVGHLTGSGPLLPGAKPARVTYGDRWREGYEFVLSDGTAFIEYLVLRDEQEATQEFIELRLLFWD